MSKSLLGVGAYSGEGAYYSIKLLEKESYWRRNENIQILNLILLQLLTNIATDIKYEKNELVSTKTMWFSTF